MGFLRSIFDLIRAGLLPPTPGAVLRQLAAQTGATYVRGRFWKRPKVLARHRNLTITLDMPYSGGEGSERIRLRAPYFSRDGFWFRISGSPLRNVGGVLGYDLGKLVGLRDVEVGYPEFDDAFVIKASDEDKARALFANARIRELLNAQPSVDLCVEEEGIRPGVYELSYSSIIWLFADVEALRSLLDLVAETLDQLCRIGSACEDRVPGPIRYEPDPLCTHEDSDKPPRFGRFGLLSVMICVSLAVVGLAALATGLLFCGRFVLLMLPPCGVGLGAAIGSLGEKSDWIMAGALLGFLVGCVASLVGLALPIW